MAYEPKTDEFLKQIAMDTADGKIFTSAHIPSNQGEMMLPSVFVPLAFLDDDARKEFKEMKIVMLFEYLDKAGPRAVNGFPIFMSLQMLNDTDATKFWDYFDEIKAAKLKFLGKEEKDMGGARAEDLVTEPKPVASVPPAGDVGTDPMSAEDHKLFDEGVKALTDTGLVLGYNYEGDKGIVRVGKTADKYDFVGEGKTLLEALNDVKAKMGKQ